MKRISIILTICLLCLSEATAQERKPWIVRSVNKLGAFIDTMATRGIDHRYIKVPKHPWQIMLKTNMNDMDLRSSSTIDASSLKTKDIDGDLKLESAFKPRFSTSIGAWFGYRGYGLGLSLSLSGNNGNNFSIGATGSNYGINLRLRNFTTREMDIILSGNDYSTNTHEEMTLEDAELYDDIDVHSTFIDGYYLLNGKRFSYAAAYDQSVIQVRSAGSLIIGAMWYHLSLDYANRLNALYMQLINNVGMIKVQEGSIGVGYAYNWVPFKNLLVSAMAIPMITLYNRNKVILYDSNYDLFLEEDKNGKKAVPDDESNSWIEDITLEKKDEIVKYGKVSLNIDARFSITYNWNRYFFNIYGQWNGFRNKIENNTLRLNTWFINTSLGIRL